MKCFKEICSVPSNKILFMKKYIHNTCLICCFLWLLISFIAAALMPEIFLLKISLGMGILFTLYFFKSTNLKIN
jgi:hypothetical protein